MRVRMVSETRRSSEIEIEGEELIDALQKAIKDEGPLPLRLDERKIGKIVSVNVIEGDIPTAEIIIEPVSQLEMRFEEVLNGY